MKKLLTIVSLLIATPVMAQVPSNITTKEQAIEYIRMRGEIYGNKLCAITKRTDLLESQIDSEYTYLYKKGYKPVNDLEYKFKISENESPYFPTLNKILNECLTN